MDSKKISKLCRTSIEDLVDKLKEDPSPELFAALHRLSLRYSLRKEDEKAKKFFRALRRIQVKEIPINFQTHFEILSETSSYARVIEVSSYKRRRKKEAVKISSDKPLVKLLSFLYVKSPISLKSFRIKSTGMKDLDRSVKKATELDYMKCIKSNYTDPYVTLTYKGRSVLNYIEDKKD